MKLGIKKILVIGVALLTIIPLFSNVISIYFQREIKKSEIALAHSAYKRDLINNFNLHITNNTLGYMDAIVDKESFKVVDEIKNKHKEIVEYFEKNKKELIETFTETLGKESAETLEKDFKTYWEGGDGLIKSIEAKKIDKTGEFDDAIDGMNEKIQDQGHQSIAKLDKIYEEAQIKMREDEEMSLRVSFITTALAMLAGIGFGFYLYKNITSELNNTNTKITSSTQSVYNISKSFNDLGHELSSAMQQQAQALQETVSALEEINATVLKNADSAELSESFADECVNSANEGRDSVRKMSSTMSNVDKEQKRILDVLNNTNEDVNGLVEVMRNITEKTKIINDIVFQTKLLSFNASVEAARAGEQGKGFAVVAEEVGNLATMSGTAAKEINDILSMGTSTVDRIVGVMTSNLNEIRTTSEKNQKEVEFSRKECEEKLQEITNKISELKMMSSTIARASKEQSIGVHEISKALNEIDQLTGRNTTLARTCESEANVLVQNTNELQTALVDLKKAIDGEQA